MIVPVVIIPWHGQVPTDREATIFGIFGGLYVMQAAFEPVSKVTSNPAPGVKVRR
jgi:hypothetical protein